MTVNTPNHDLDSKEPTPSYLVGVKKNPDGSLDYSQAATWEGLKSYKEKEPELREDVQKILKHLDQLDEVLAQDIFKLNSSNLDRNLNHNLTAITAFSRVLDTISRHEYAAIIHKAHRIEDKMRQALDKCKAEKIKREHDMGGEYVHESTFRWLEQEGPAVMKSLATLKIEG